MLSSGHQGHWTHMVHICTCGQNTYMYIIKRPSTELPYGPVILPVSAYTKVSKAGTQTDICPPLVWTASFTISRRQSHRHQPTGEWRKKRMCLSISYILFSLKNKGGFRWKWTGWGGKLGWEGNLIWYWVREKDWSPEASRKNVNRKPQEIGGLGDPPFPEFTRDLGGERLPGLKGRDLRWNSRKRELILEQEDRISSESHFWPIIVPAWKNYRDGNGEEPEEKKVQW